MDKAVDSISLDFFHCVLLLC